MLAAHQQSLPTWVQGSDMDSLLEIFRDEVNLAVWQRPLAPPVQRFANAVLQRGGQLAEAYTLEVATDQQGNPSVCLPRLVGATSHLEGYAEFVADVAHLVDAFACLVDAQRIGLRLRSLDQAMCPRWHVDHVPVRLVSSYAGPGSEWLQEGQLPREHLGGPGIDRYAREVSGQALAAGDVALLKGERWQGNAGRGLVHRSPTVAEGQRRLLLTLDWLK